MKISFPATTNPALQRPAQQKSPQFGKNNQPMTTCALDGQSYQIPTALYTEIMHPYHMLLDRTDYHEAPEEKGKLYRQLMRKMLDGPQSMLDRSLDY